MSPQEHNTLSAPQSPRKVGAPPGNTNALKHGFYSRRFKRIDLTDLENHSFSGLQDEITMLRVYIRRVIELSNDIDNLPEAVGFLRAISLAAISLTRLLKTQLLLGGNESDEIAAVLSQALDQLDNGLLELN